MLKLLNPSLWLVVWDQISLIKMSRRVRFPYQSRSGVNYPQRYLTLTAIYAIIKLMRGVWIPRVNEPL